MLRMLGGEDMVERCQLIVVSIFCIRVSAVQVLCEFQHIVRVAALRSVDVVDEVGASLLAREMLASAVSSECERPLTSDHIPEERRSMVVALVAAQLGDTLESHGFRHLRVGVHVVEVVLPFRHRVEQPFVGEPLCAVHVFLVFRDGVCVGDDLVHAAMLVAQHLLHLLVGESGCEIDHPVGKTQEQRARFLVAAIKPSIAQTGIHLVKVIKRCP